MINLLPEPLRPGVPRAGESWAVFGIAMGMLLLGGSVCAIVVMAIELSRGASWDSLLASQGRWMPLYVLVTEGSLGLCVGGAISLLRLDWRRTLRLNPAPLRTYPLAVGGSLALGVVGDFVLLWLYRAAPWLSTGVLESFKDWVSYSGPASFLGLVLVLALLPAVCEEALFRGFIQKGFERSYRPVKAIFWSGVLFGLMHVDPLQALGVLLMGFFLGFVAYRTNSLYPSVVAHGVNNAVAIYAANQRLGGLETTLGQDPSWLALGVGLAGASLCVLGLWHATRSCAADWRLRPRRPRLARPGWEEDRES
jgi:membrane protease YdiL (CAAX protease family)